MEITVNGEKRQMGEDLMLERLLDQLKLERKNLAIEHNGRFIEDDTDLATIAVREGDRLEIVRFVGGG